MARVSVPLEAATNEYTSPMRHVLALATACLLCITAAKGGAQPRFSFGVVAAGLASPWEVALGPDGRLWVTERTARRVVRIDPAGGRVTPALTIDDSYDPGQSWHEGLMGLALHPELSKGTGRDYVFVGYTYDADPGPQLQRRFKVRRYTYRPATGTLANPVDIISNIPAYADHAGGRMTIGPDRKLYLTRGDGGANWANNPCLPSMAQDLPDAAQLAAKDWRTYVGKILRMNLDGSVPADNPVLKGVRSHIYSYGHRNPQGLGFGPTGLLYASEHGPSTDDELNLVSAGGNYGWPYVAGYADDRNYTFADWAHATKPPCSQLTFDEFEPPPSVRRQRESEWRDTFTPPIRTFFTPGPGYSVKASGSLTIAAGGLEVYAARTGVPGWAPSILQTSLTMGRVYRVPLSADGRTAAGANEEIFRAANRYRDIAVSADGLTFYLATDNNGFGQVVEPAGGRVKQFANPGAIVAFTYQRQRK
jgi:PQQ-dependent dehydrogenase (s-GDH family)